MSRHSTIVGGSTAGRLIECPGSYQAQLALPPSADVSSEYALEGTFCHAVMDRLMRNRQIGAITQANPEHWLGQTFADRELTQAHIDEMIAPALELLRQLEQDCGYGGGFRVLGVEARVKFPGIPGAFGTCDLILGNSTHVLHVDWKFGSGVSVEAVTADELDEKLNPQMMFYTAAAVDSLKALYKGKRQLVIAIIQPRGSIPLTHTIVTKRDLKWFVEDLQKAVVDALDRNPHRSRGDHCRFAPCKIDCPLWTGPLLDLADMKLIPRTEMVTKGPSPYGDYLARAKALVDTLADYTKEVNEQLHAYLEDGGEVPGWKLKAKVKARQWIDEVEVEHALEDVGFDTKDIYERKLVTFAAAEKTAKRLGVRIPDHLRVAPPTNETTVTRADDPAPAIERATAIEQFRASIPLLTGKG
jgi:Protein of unknown function (DUF2800)